MQFSITNISNRSVLHCLMLSHTCEWCIYHGEKNITLLFSPYMINISIFGSQSRDVKNMTDITIPIEWKLTSSPLFCGMWDVLTDEVKSKHQCCM